MGVNYLSDYQTIRSVAKDYNPLDYHRTLCELLNRLYPSDDFLKRPKIELHKIINDAILEFYNGEQSLKYYLFKYFSSKNVVCGFEMKVNKSRVDFLAVNGKSSSFEIKSGLDNLDKLYKQTSDFVKAFEFNYVVIDEIHLEKALKILPSSYGIWSFKNGCRKIHRVAILNKELDCQVQLELLTQAELKMFFDGNTEVSQILNSYKSTYINSRFKLILKYRYGKRWEFIVNNREQILPIDVQFFYNKNIHPSHIYM